MHADAIARRWIRQMIPQARNIQRYRFAISTALVMAPAQIRRLTVDIAVKRARYGVLAPVLIVFRKLCTRGAKCW